ncbi:MAG: hypothetical protein ACHQ1D_01525 [Nitrososphaerales archaeon]
MFDPRIEALEEFRPWITEEFHSMPCAILRFKKGDYSHQIGLVNHAGPGWYIAHQGTWIFESRDPLEIVKYIRTNLAHKRIYKRFL